MTKTLSESEAWEVIKAGKLGRLGCIVKDEPYVVPINYYFEGDSFYSHSLPGRKIEALRIHPRACLQVDKIEDELHWQSAIAFGTFEEVHNERERTLIMRNLLRRFPLLTAVESSIVQDATPPEIVIFRVRIDRVTGVAED